jgi:hypothetical protein
VQIRQKERKPTHARKSKPHDLHGSPLDADAADIEANVDKIEPQISVNGASYEVTDSLESGPPSPIPYVYFTPPLSNSQTTSWLNSPCPSPKFTQSQHGERVLSIGNSSVEIGDLGKRRGFKGAPLFTQSLTKRSFLSLHTCSPRSGNPSFAQGASLRSLSSSPCSPFVTNLMRSTSPQSSGPIYEVSPQPEFQIFYDEADPFSSHGETFITSSPPFGAVFTADLDNFAPYYRHQPTHRRMLPLKRKVSFDELQSRASSTNKNLMKTTIYDMTLSVGLTSAVTPATTKKSKVMRPTHPPISTGSPSPNITLTSPSSHTKTVCSVADMLPIDLPVVQESSGRLRVPAKQNQSSKVKAKPNDKDSLVSDRFSSASGPVLNSHGLLPSLKKSHTQFKPSSDPADKPAVNVTQIPDDWSENALTDVTLSDSKNRQDDDAIDVGSGLLSPVIVPLTNFCDLSAHGSALKDTSGRKSAHPDLRDATPPKLRKHRIAKLDTNVYDLSIYGVDADLPRLGTCSLRPAMRLAAELRLDEPDMCKPLIPINQVSQLRSVVLPTRAASCESSTSSLSTDGHCPSDMSNAVTDCHSRGLNEIIAQLDADVLDRAQAKGRDFSARRGAQQ